MENEWSINDRNFSILFSKSRCSSKLIYYSGKLFGKVCKFQHISTGGINFGNCFIDIYYGGWLRKFPCSMHIVKLQRWERAGCGLWWKEEALLLKWLRIFLARGFKRECLMLFQSNRFDKYTGAWNCPLDLLDVIISKVKTTLRATRF